MSREFSNNMVRVHGEPEGEMREPIEIKIHKDYDFVAGHVLPGHTGHCRNPHGHNYLVRVWFKGHQVQQPGASDDGMLIDFSDVNKVIKPILEEWDHAVLSCGPETMDYYNPLKTKFAYLGIRTTAENIARYLWTEIAFGLGEEYRSRVHLMGVIVWETPKAAAEYIHSLQSPSDILRRVIDATKTGQLGEVVAEDSQAIEAEPLAGED
jgi:6-pyruvoyltetrahydropterin/6-carboxytetrahydropterin synthase